MVDNRSQTQDTPITYLEKLKNLTCIHKDIQDSISNLIKILEMRITPSKQTLMNLNHYAIIIDKELEDEEYGMVYSNIDLLSIHLPNLRREQLNWNTLQQEELRLLVDYIEEIIIKANKIKEKIVNVPIKQDNNLMNEQEKIAFEQIQRKCLLDLNELSRKADFLIKLKIIKDRINTEEKKILTNNICLEFYGGKLEDIGWKTTVKNAKQ